MSNSNLPTSAKFLVTGASGFIGTSLVRHLVSLGCNVYGVDTRPSSNQSSNYIHIQRDILGINASDLFSITGEVNFVIHLAARTDLNGSNLLAYDVNLSGLILMCEYAKMNPSVSFLFASTQLVNGLGDTPSSYLDYSPDSFYGLSKVLGETIVSSFFNTSANVRWIIFRPTTVWGPGMSLHYRNFLSLLCKRRYFHIGLKACLKSFSYIENASSQIIDLAVNVDRYKSSSIHYLCDEEPVNIVSWANDLAVSMNAKRPLFVPRFVAFFLATLNDLFSSLLRLSSPLIPLTRRRFRNIITPYLYNSRELWSSENVVVVPYRQAIKHTADWFLSLKTFEGK
jgi:nucleoside-diphosphate-sugar epimerase